MDVDPLSGYAAQFGLRPVALADQPVLNAYFKSLAQPLSDYTFSQLFSWQNGLRILWRELEGHLCVFANGTGDLTLLLPPIGDTGSDRALAGCWEIMDAYNAAHRVPECSRVEYASEELLVRFDRARVSIQQMGADYVYDVTRMIDLAGGDLASKRQAKNRFLRNYVSRVETYDKSKHFDECCALLDTWQQRQDATHAMEISATASGLKRQKESLATRLSLEYADELSLAGMVVYVADAANGSESIRGFTFGERLGADQSSIVIEKTDLAFKGLAQYIFSEFCRGCWSDRPLVNVGDDWGLESLAWTKMSYRPVRLLRKYVLGKVPVVMVGTGGGVPCAMSDTRRPIPEIHTRRAGKDDLAAMAELEQSCFTAYSLTRRRLQYLQSRPNNVFLVAEQGGRVVGEAIALVRHHRNGVSGRVYSLAVNSACRGQRIGRRLMEALFDALAVRGVHRVYLEVEQTNTAAINLYGTMGFRSTGPLPNYYGQGRGGLHMMCEIPEQPQLFQNAVA
jgi:ribosomal protein S18 acetylase RimI-like enzyme